MGNDLTDTLLSSFQSHEPIRWDELLDASNTHKLMYSLQIVEYLSRPPRIRKSSIVSRLLLSSGRLLIFSLMLCIL